MNYKEEFKKWVLNNLKDKSGAGPSYISSIDWLSDKFYEAKKLEKKSIFEIDDVNLITNLHLEVKKIQRDQESFIFNKNAPSYGNKYFYSASIGKYKEFLQNKIGKETTNNDSLKKQEKFDVKQFEDKIFEAGLIFSKQIIQRFLSSLCTKPFVICSGLSGSGKTKLAQAFALWICEDKSQYEIIPVGADWTNREPLLGFPNALNSEEYVSPENGVLDLIIRANENYNDKNKITKPFFLILDEMNLSHVERYFADFLSAMESNEPISLHKITNEKNKVPNSISLTKNLFIIGTVNIDETTYMFSPKVLDRANTIEFRITESNLEEFIENDIPLKMELLDKEGANMSSSFMEIVLLENDKNLQDSKSDLLLFFSELKKSGAEFGYRTTNEIGRLMYMLNQFDNKDTNLLDIAIMQKLLPKLHGSRSKLSKILPILGEFCVINKEKIKDNYFDKFIKDEIDEKNINDDENIKYKISFEKICRMYKNAVENGFASYAEA